jgi:cell division protein FtsA
LTPRERELGVLLLDIGAGTTSLCIFEEENLIHLAVFPIGSGNITNDIAICLKTDIDTAEKIKIQFGNCFLERKGKKFQKKEKIKIEGLDSEEPLSFTNKMLVEIIEARVVEILREVQKELKKIGKAGLLPAGIVLTGGGVGLPNIKEFCKNYLKLPCRIGLARGFSPELNDPSFASVAGLVLEGLDLVKEKGFSIGPKGIFAKIKRALRIFIP